MTTTYDRAFVSPYATALTGEGGVLAPRLTAAWLAVCDVLADGKPRPYSDVLAAMCAAGAIAHGTARNLLWEAANRGLAHVTPRDSRHPRAPRYVTRPVGVPVFDSPDVTP